MNEKKVESVLASLISKDAESVGRALVCAFPGNGVLEDRESAIRAASICPEATFPSVRREMIACRQAIREHEADCARVGAPICPHCRCEQGSNGPCEECLRAFQQDWIDRGGLLEDF